MDIRLVWNDHHFSDIGMACHEMERELRCAFHDHECTDGIQGSGCCHRGTHQGVTCGKCGNR